MDRTNAELDRRDSVILSDYEKKSIFRKSFEILSS